MRCSLHLWRFAIIVGALVALPAGSVRAQLAESRLDDPPGPTGVQFFINDYPGFHAASPSLSTIDFETLPDGSPSVAGTRITETFNYDLQGAHFTAPLSPPRIAGNATFGYGLISLEFFPDVTWIDARLITPAKAVGIYFAGGTRLYAYDQVGELIAWTYYSGSGDSFFLGILSETLIGSVKVIRGGSTERINAFLFAPIPEPATMALLGIFLPVLLARRFAPPFARGCRISPPAR